MRKVNRVVGGLLILGLASMGFSVLSDVISAASWPTWLFLAIGIGLLFVGRHYYFRLPLVIPDERQKQAPQQPFAPFVAAHRRELSVLAQIGLTVSLFRLVGLCYGAPVGRMAARRRILRTRMHRPDVAKAVAEMDRLDLEDLLERPDRFRGCDRHGLLESSTLASNGTDHEHPCHRARCAPLLRRSVRIHSRGDSISQC